MRLIAADGEQLGVVTPQEALAKARESGLDVVVIAEPSKELAAAASGKPAGDEAYWSRVIELPASGDPALFVFAAAAVLQRLAYRMSVLKSEWLDALGVQAHGVHPDVPKNVSKSITVD